MRKTIYAFTVMLLLTATVFTSCKKDPVEDTKKDPPGATSECFEMYEVSTHYEDVEAVSFINANEGWACVADNALGLHTSIMHTTDGGKTWAVIAENIHDKGVQFQNFYFINETTGFMITSESDLLGTTDKGVTWQTIYEGQGAGIDQNLVYAIASNSSQTVCYFRQAVGGPAMSYISNTTLQVTNTISMDYSITTSIHLSESGAITFGPILRENHDITEMAHMDPSGNMHFSELHNTKTYYHPGTAMNFPSENVGYFVGDTGQHAKGIVYKTIDGGKTWSEIYKLEDHQESFTFFDFADENNGLAGSGSSFAATYKTTDGGITWERIDCITDRFVLPWFIAYPDVDHMYLCTPIHPFDASIRFFTYPK